MLDFRSDATSPTTYRRRTPEETLLYQIIQQEFATFAADAAQRGRYLPPFVHDEFDKYLECGQLACGFVRVYCTNCRENRCVAFSCKRRAFCPSCCSRRMSETATQLVDHVLPHAPVRQWVLSVPPFLRYRMAYNAELCSAVLGIFHQEIFRWYRWTAKKVLGLASVGEAHPGSVTWIQRFSSALALNVHFHALVLDGVFVEEAKKPAPTFRALPAPSQDEVAAVVVRVHKRVMALLEKGGLCEDGARDDLADAEPLLAACASASVQGRIALGEHAGAPVVRLRSELPVPRRLGTRCIEVEGFNLHANVRIAANDRKRLERLARYTGRPPVATDRLGPLSDGRVGYRLKRPWSDGTTFVVFERQTFIEKLVALIPPPRVHQIRYFGVLAPNARLRAAVVASVPRANPESSQGDCHRRPKRVNWSDLLRRVFEVDVLVCPKCSGKMEIIATILDRGVAGRILESCGLAQGPPPTFAPARQKRFDFEPWVDAP